MRRINATSAKELTDAKMAEGLSDLGIPYIDMGEGPKTVRRTGPNGEIVDEVVQSGEPGEEWTLEGPQETAIKNARDIKRQRDISTGKRFDTI